MNVAELPTDTDCAVSWRARPASFVSLMSLYESNYIRLGWLIEDLSAVEGRLISAVDGDCPLHLKVEERSRYTTTVTLTYIFEQEMASLADPDLQIRVYHDARLAEVQSCARWHRHAILESIRSGLARALGERWLRNVMLNKWLDYCVERGHRFGATPALAR
ncbi:DUF1249 domain-containing protein [Povalibacter uvarum]|uniref:DUF1249 domain-containing protein n=1 Tax=Povalibacter uvarum TaxID=732238 RepID=UPI0016168E70|nr:DUF1249 domain-containing protein [Povalibacter uvarum]